MDLAPLPMLVETVSELRNLADGWRRAGLSVAVVPTMGALHAGHRSLMEQAKRSADQLVVTIFVNPTQFSATEDLTSYPRQLALDLELCRAERVDAVFAPAVSEMYPPGDSTRVTVKGLTDHLCGASRPQHFEGVATVVTKLLAAVGPSLAIFGKKDYQQLQVIKRLVRDLMLPVTIQGAPIVRESDGVALSSRNAFLGREDRVNARALVEALSAAAEEYAAGERRVEVLLARARSVLDVAELRVDYLTLADPDTLQPVFLESLAGPALLAVAAFVGPTRLIDNVVLGEDASPLAPAALERGEA